MGVSHLIWTAKHTTHLIWLDLTWLDIAWIYGSNNDVQNRRNEIIARSLTHTTEHTHKYTETHTHTPWYISVNMQKPENCVIIGHYLFYRSFICTLHEWVGQGIESNHRWYWMCFSFANYIHLVCSWECRERKKDKERERKKSIPKRENVFEHILKFTMQLCMTKQQNITETTTTTIK